MNKLCKKTAKIIGKIIEGLFWIGRFAINVVTQVIFDGERANIFLRNSNSKNPIRDLRKLDSRSISPPRFGNPTERAIFNGVDKSIENSEINYLLPYQSASVHASIFWFKYKRDTYTVKLLARILVDEILDEVSGTLDKRSVITNWVIAPAPSTSFSTGEKGWDHNVDISKEMGKLLGKSFSVKQIFEINSALKKTFSNKKLGRFDRIVSTANKFSLKSNTNLPRRSGLIIFDDVTTTGATLKELGSLARNLNPEITLLISLAH